MATTNTKIYFTARVEGWHSYPLASGTHKFLENRHRHLFYFRAKLGVTDDDREIEFIDARADFIQNISYTFYNNIEKHGCEFQHRSCEMIGRWCIQYLRHKYGERYIAVDVSEDGENGALVHYIPDRRIVEQAMQTLENVEQS